MDHVPWESDAPLTPQERNAISKSIAVFQLGENSEGNSFMRAGKRYAEQSGDKKYLAALNLFIREEQRHSAVLGQFMDRQNISRIHKEWTDSSFRFIRKLAGLNICVAVLLTAEIVAAVYYRALGQATRSPVLRAICGQILVDEAYHLRFQAGTLAKAMMNWSPIRRWLFRQIQRLLLAGTILVVWKEHRSVYQAGQFSFFQWWSMTWSTLEEVLLTIQASRNERDDSLNLPLPDQTSHLLSPHLPTKVFGDLF